LPFFSSVLAVFLVFIFFFFSFHPTKISGETSFYSKAAVFSVFSGGIRSKSRELYRFLSYKWYFDAIYNELINRPLLIFAYKIIFKTLDKGLLELFGPYGGSFVLFLSATKTKKMQLGGAYYYAYLMITFLLVFLIFLQYLI